MLVWGSKQFLHHQCFYLPCCSSRLLAGEETQRIKMELFGLGGRDMQAELGPGAQMPKAEFVPILWFSDRLCSKVRPSGVSALYPISLTVLWKESPHTTHSQQNPAQMLISSESSCWVHVLNSGLSLDLGHMSASGAF